MIELIDLGFYFGRETNSMQFVSMLEPSHHVTHFADLSYLR
jgi:hypothetical protein